MSELLELVNKDLLFVLRLHELAVMRISQSYCNNGSLQISVVLSSGIIIDSVLGQIYQ